MITTRHSVITAAICGVISLALESPVPAHHSYVMFDMSKHAEISGTVRALEWVNPHVWLWVNANDEKGQPAVYAFEGTSPGEMNRRSAWTRTTVSFGDKVTVKYLPFKDSAKKGGRIVAVTLPDGRTLGAASH